MGGGGGWGRGNGGGNMETTVLEQQSKITIKKKNGLLEKYIVDFKMCMQG